jgi:hypothetical protein
VPLQWAASFGAQGVALMHLAERTKDATMAESAIVQIEAALETARAGGHAPLTTFYEAGLFEARRIRDALRAP